MTTFRSMGFAVLLAPAVLAACASSDPQTSGVRNEVNACATQGATYLLHMVQRAGGTCGNPPDRVVNLDDPAITNVFCAAVTQANCVARGTDCVESSDGCTSTYTYKTTFAADGASATSLHSVSMRCSDGSSCSSTYDTTMTRQ